MATLSHRLLTLLLAGLFVVASGCATAGEDDDNPAQPDGSPADDAAPPDDSAPPVDAAPPIDTAPPIDAPPPQPQPITISHSNSTAITSGNSVACINNTTGFHRANSYYRTFALSTLGITSEFSITSVRVGIESAVGNGGLQPATLNLYRLSGAFTLANLTLIGTVGVTITDASLTTRDLPITTTVPAGSTLVVELFLPDGEASGNTFFIGSNASGQTAPTFLRAPDCGITEPTATSDAAIGVPNMHMVMSVSGTHFP